ncbi:unnamed protein product [Amaranthus hypochondriacus]
MVLVNPRIISYSIEPKLTQFVDFLTKLGLNEEGMIGKILVKNPFLMSYDVEKRLQPTAEFLKKIGLSKTDLQKVVVNYTEPDRGFGIKLARVLMKSIKNSLEPKLKFLIQVMGKSIPDVVDYLDFFRHGQKKSFEYHGIRISLTAFQICVI